LLTPVRTSAISAGISPETGKAMYAMAFDSPLIYTFDEALECAQSTNKHMLGGHDDWRVPTMNELNFLFNNGVAVGRFSAKGYTLNGWYWSSTRSGRRLAWHQSFDDGDQRPDSKGVSCALRLVR
jgi:hypothetical protein